MWVEGVDFTKTSGTTITRISGTFNGTDVATLLKTSSRVKVWINGTPEFVQLNTETITDSNLVMTAAYSRKFLLGNVFNAVATPTYGPVINMPVSSVTGGYLGYVDAGAGDVNVTVDFVIYDHGPNADPATTSNNGADIDLSAFEAAGATPALIYFGGEQVAADWNAGTNLGSVAGPLTMNGSVA